MSRDYSRKSGREFSRIASEYDKGRRGEDLELWGNETKRLANLEEEDLVLDLGCGTGLYTVAIGRESDALMYGMDPAVGMLGQAREISRDVHWFNGIGEWLPVRDGLLDCIFSSQVWHHIQDRQGTADECGSCHTARLNDHGRIGPGFVPAGVCRAPHAGHATQALAAESGACVPAG